MERTCVKKPCRYCMAATATATTNAIRRLRPRRCRSVRVRSRPVHSIVTNPTAWLELRSRLGLGLGLGLGRAGLGLGLVHSTSAAYIENKVALRRPRSAADHASGCPKLRQASANQPPGRCWPARQVLFPTWRDAAHPVIASHKLRHIVLSKVLRTNLTCSCSTILPLTKKCRVVFLPTGQNAVTTTRRCRGARRPLLLE